jgi:hypothetical protein
MIGISLSNQDRVGCNTVLQVTDTFTVEDMRRFAGEAWGAFGVSVVSKWCEFNARYFDGALKPVPLVITNAQPFGKLLAFCSYGSADTGGRTITLNIPKHHVTLVADNNTLVHEMVHQFLFERGEYAKHDGAPWRREIMRLTPMISGKTIWAGRSTTKRRDGKVVRMNAPNPESGEPSLPQAAIARWPHDGLGINLGQLGA